MIKLHHEYYKIAESYVAYDMSRRIELLSVPYNATMIKSHGVWTKRPIPMCTTTSFYLLALCLPYLIFLLCSSVYFHRIVLLSVS